MTHSGRYCYQKPLIAFHDPILDPRIVVDKTTGKTIDASYPLLDDDYLKRLVDHYVRAARLAHRIGFQFVDIKQCHRYLLSELLAAKTRPAAFLQAAQNSGARFLVYGGIHKQSTLVQWALVHVVDLKKDKLVLERTLSFRGDTDEAFRRAADFIVDYLKKLPAEP